MFFNSFSKSHKQNPRSILFQSKSRNQFHFFFVQINLLLPPLMDKASSFKVGLHSNRKFQAQIDLLLLKGFEKIQPPLMDRASNFKVGLQLNQKIQSQIDLLLLKCVENIFEIDDV
uniref:Uncharacterized protein n=1 Tax=Spongospora subterranea TaxID=70186 RepID=A0A0H5QT42_9EUKA|eukprot:CRZ05188.1 hypothetical protein [Spongospora subterranea]